MTSANVNQGNMLTVTMTAQWSLVNYVKTFSYTGSAQTWTVPYTGNYKIELWGASGNWDAYSKAHQYPDFTKMFGYGGYTAGTIDLSKTENLYVYVGQQGPKGTEACNTTTGIAWNGGGQGVSARDCSGGGSAGGGATDIRTTSGAWNNASSLRSRIMVAGAGGGGPTLDIDEIGSGSGGGLSGVGDVLRGWSSTCRSFTNNSSGTQTSGYAFGYGQDGIRASGTAGGAGGGGGYWGGLNTAASTTNASCQDSGAGGGSSYISGHTGAVAIQSASSSAAKSGCSQGTTNNSCSIHYSGKKFTNTTMIDGEGKQWTNTRGGYKVMPNPSGGSYSSGAGHTGNGYAKITWLGS